MKLSERIVENGIIINSKNTDKESLIAELVDFAVKVFDLNHRDEILDAVYTREHHKSTGVGSGVAVPHAKVDYVNQMHMVAASIRGGIDFDAQDKRPVYLIVLLLSPSNTIGPHVQALSAIARIMADGEIRRSLINAETPAEFWGYLKEAEDNSASI